jgi:phospholipase A2
MKKIIVFLLFIAFPTLSYSMHALETFIQTEVQIVSALIAPHLEEEIDGEQPAIMNNPYKDTIAHTKKTDTISLEEQKYRKKRESFVHVALHKYFACTSNIKKTPTIACIFSGGGYRAMLGCLGSLRALEKENLLNCVTYISTLSGSTWALSSWISTQMTLHNFTRYLHKCAAKPFFEITQQEKVLIANMIAVKKLSHQPLTLVDIYGGLLGNRLLENMKDKKHMTYLSQQTDIINNARYPYPIYTAISADEDNSTSWYTFTPHTVENITHNISIPTYGCGRDYNNGISINTVPELPLSVLLGTWGSAFAADWNTIIEAAEDKEASYKTFLKELEKLIKPIGKERPIPCELKLPNFTKGMENPISKHKNLKLVDAGIDINLPYIPFSGICPERTADIMLFFDNSASPLGKAFKECVEFAQQHNLPFPSVDLNNIDKKTVSIFADSNPQAPLVIYMPGISDAEVWEKNKLKKGFKHYNLSGFDLKKETDEGFCQTQNFQYTPEHARLVTYQTEFNFRAHKNMIKNAIKAKIDAMNSL